MAGIWAALTQSLNWLMRSQLGNWILIALGALGLQLAITEGAIDPLLDHIRNNVQGVPGDLAAWLGFFNVDKYLTLILSAYAAAAVGGWAIRKARP